MRATDSLIKPLKSQLFDQKEIHVYFCISIIGCKKNSYSEPNVDIDLDFGKIILHSSQLQTKLYSLNKIFKIQIDFALFHYINSILFIMLIKSCFCINVKELIISII